MLFKMKKIPPIDLSGLVKILRKEGRDEMSSNLTKTNNNPFAPSLATIKREWDDIVDILEKELIPQLSKGGELSHLKPSVNALTVRVMNLTLIATQVLSIVPGPIGIISSIINAIACFSTGNVLGGIIELLGCIPGAKLAVKGGGKFSTKIGDEVYAILKNNKKLAVYLENWEKMIEKTKVYTETLNMAEIKQLTQKLQKEINDIEKYIPASKGKFDTGPTQNLSLDGIFNNRSVINNRVSKGVNNGRQLQNRGISINGVGYGIYSQMKTKLWK